VLRVASASDVSSDASTLIAPSAVLSGDCKLPAAAVVVLPFSIAARRVPGGDDGVKLLPPGQEVRGPAHPLRNDSLGLQSVCSAGCVLCCAAVLQAAPTEVTGRLVVRLGVSLSDAPAREFDEEAGRFELQLSGAFGKSHLSLSCNRPIFSAV
jgi:hypothetical protein